MTSSPFRIAHLSDLHVLALDGVSPLRMLNKRATGWVNLRFRRKHAHRSELVSRLAEHLRDARIDHVVVTGDVTNLALDEEFAGARELLEEGLGLDPSRVSLVPGNHDVYTAGAHRAKRFAKHFASYLVSDLPDLPTDPTRGPFPFVKLRGPAAIIGLSTAVPRLPFVAAGSLGARQLDALARVLEHPEVRARTPVILQHHPAHRPETASKRLLESLHDAGDLAAVLANTRRGLLLHGHLHRRIHQTLATREGHVDAIGATSSSLVHPEDERMAGFNVYELKPDGAIGRIASHAVDASGGNVREVAIPRTAWR